MVEPRKSHDFVKRIYTAWSREPDKDADAVGRKWERWRSISRGEIFLPGWVNAQGPIQDPVLALRKKRCTDGPRGTYGLSALNDRIFFQCVRRQRSFRSASGPLKDLFRTCANYSAASEEKWTDFGTVLDRQMLTKRPIRIGVVCTCGAGQANREWS